MKFHVIVKDFLFGSLFFFGILLTACGQESDTTQTDSAMGALQADTIKVDTLVEVAPEPENITIIGVGDMMLGTNYPSKSYLPANGGKDLLAELEPLLSSADVTFGNLEGTILNSGGTAKRCNNPNLCYVFRSPESYIDHFVNAGFDVLSIANNHSGDFGPQGRKRTKEVLEAANIEYAGLAGTDEMAIFEKNGVKYGFCAFAPNVGTVDVRNISKAKQIVAKLAEETDIVIVSFHGGAEGSKHQHMTFKTEYYYGENRGNVYNFAHAVVDAGADVVFGHGPHVTRAAELYKERFIIYSLGNFCTYGRFNLRGEAGIAPVIELEVAPDGTFVKGRAIPVYQQKTHGPKIDGQNRAIKTLQRLIASDFPDSQLVVDDEGNLSAKK
jgi:poly-gamma-glutamate capsule biosynthesis protein CapA/YwtB (metallophosphatase superfamily)